MAIVKAREWTVDDLIVEFEDTRDRENRTYCPICRKLREKRDAGEWVGTAGVELFEQWIFDPALHGLGVPYIVDVIRTAGTHHPPEIAADVQLAYAQQLATYPWDRIRLHLEVLLETRQIVYGIAPAAMRVLMGIIRDHHPNPKAFALKPRVRERIPEDVDFTNWRCPDFPQKRTAVARGARANDEPPPEEVEHVQLTGLESAEEA